MRAPLALVLVVCCCVAAAALLVGCGGDGPSARVMRATGLDTLRASSDPPPDTYGFKRIGSDDGPVWLVTYALHHDSTTALTVVRDADTTRVVLPTSVLADLDAARRRAVPDAAAPERSAALEASYGADHLTVRATAPALVVGAGLPLVLAVGLGAWAWRRARARRQALRASRTYLAEGREKERRHLAREIHDGPIQALYALRMHAAALHPVATAAGAAEQAEGSGATPAGDVEALDDGLVAVARELRALSEDLRPPALAPFGLGAALRDLAERLEERYAPLAVRARVPDTDGPVVPEAPRLVLFRIAQEALHNAAQHAHADTLTVTLTLAPDAVTLVVADDGTGFAPPDDWNALAEAGHYGLVGMAERAASLDGTLTLDTTPGEGTRVRAEVPR